jgi:hypothetical protein
MNPKAWQIMDTIEHKIVKIQIGSNLFHTITKTQFPIQLVVTQTIHCSQGLILDCLTFDLINVTKPSLTYIALLRVHSKKI